MTRKLLLILVALVAVQGRAQTAGLASSSLQTAPSTTSNINAITTNWSFYTATSATGGVTVPASAAQTFGVTCPWNTALTDCMELTETTAATSTQTNILATYKGIVPNFSHSNFTNSFLIYYTGTPSSLEFDVPFYDAQTMLTYMFGVQCNLGTGYIQIDNQNTSWKNSNGPASCSALTAGAVHAISYNVSLVPLDTDGCASASCEYFNWVTIDGTTSYNFGTEPATPLTYGYGGLEGPQVQVDIGATSGTALTVDAYYESANFSAYSTCANGTCSPVTLGYAQLAAAATTATVANVAVTANSIIDLHFDASLGSRMGVTCNTTDPAAYVSARSPGVSFTIVGSAPATDPACFSYTIMY